MHKFDNIEKDEVLPKNDDVRGWLLAQMKADCPQTLLAFADDGVIWGTWDGKTLVTAHEIDSSHPELRGKTLREAHIFDADGEVRLFRDELDHWKAVRISDSSDMEKVIIEKQILWGDKPAEKQPTQPGFLRVLAERKGIPSQLIPTTGKLNEKTCVRLEVHHLVEYNSDGEAYIVTSRLAGVSVGSKIEEASNG